MSKTADLRQLIVEQLKTVPGGVYHRLAPDDAAYPYKVFTLQRVALGDLSRDDYTLCVDIWDKSLDPKTAEQIADNLSDLFNAANLPRQRILPTFFREDCYPVEDADKDIIHYQTHFSVQLYTR